MSEGAASGAAIRCGAPSMSLHLSPDGTVRPCCVSTVPLGSIRGQRLTEIWRGHLRRQLVAQQLLPGVPVGCGACATQISVEGRRGSYPALFDGLEPAHEQATTWPTRIEFNLSNACNLQCVQCDGAASSAIRAHRERRPPLPKAYDDRFFEDLADFLPHVEVAQFAGGEPFLASENFRVWQMLADMGSTATCNVVTNGTQWNDRIERVLQQLRVGFTLSLDGITRETFEAIRVGSDFTVVMENFERMIEHATAAGTPISVNHCLMAQNYREFPELLLWAEQRGVHVDVSVVRGPERCAISSLPAPELARVHEWLVGQDQRVARQLRLNQHVWTREVERIGRWRAASAEGIHAMWERSRYGSVLDLPGSGTPNHGDAEALSRLEALATDGRVHWVAVGADDIIHELSPGVAELLGVPGDRLRGAHVEVLQALVGARFGEQVDGSQTRLGPDRMDATAVFERCTLHSSVIALRDEHGWARDGRILFAVES